MNDHMTDPQTEYYIVPKSVYDDALLSPSARLLYGAIMYAARNPENRGWRTNASYAEQFVKSERSVTAWVAELEDAGCIYIETVLRSNSNQVYRRYITPNVIMGQIDGRRKLPKDIEGRTFLPKGVEENCAGKNNIKKNNTIGDEPPKEVIKKKPKKVFVPPTQEEVISYLQEKGASPTLAQAQGRKFWLHYEATEWTRGRYSIKISKWKASLMTWMNNHQDFNK
jgi:hypothetical protein